MLAADDPGDPRLPGIIERAHHLGKSGLDEARRAIGMQRDDELPGPERLAELLPDIVLMDLRMPRCDGVEATRLLGERVPETKIVILTTYADDRSVIDALRAGARGYLTKDAGGAEIRHALRQVLDNHAVIDPAVQHHVVDAIAALSPAQTRRSISPLPAGLTPREAEVLSLIATGMSNGEIAEHLVVSEGTVKSHINHLLAKIDARDRAQAVAFAYQRGLALPREQPG